LLTRCEGIDVSEPFAISLQGCFFQTKEVGQILKTLSRYINLKSIDLSENCVDLAALSMLWESNDNSNSSLVNLTHLSLRNTGIEIGDKLGEFVCNLKLEALDVSENCCSEEDLLDFTQRLKKSNLQELSLESMLLCSSRNSSFRTSVQAADLPKQLRKLSIANNNFSSSTLQSLLRKLPESSINRMCMSNVTPFNDQVKNLVESCISKMSAIRIVH
jgi:hypothetical protein